MNRHKEVNTVRDTKLDTKWRETVNVGIQYAKRRQET